MVESRIYGQTRLSPNDGRDSTGGNYFTSARELRAGWAGAALEGKVPDKKPLSSLGGKVPCVNLIRYADDFVITGRTKELLEGEIKPLVEQFLQKRGLELSPTKTVITHVEQGFDFLGQNVRKYPCGKLLIKPSKKNVKTFLEGIRGTIKAALGMSAADLIDWSQPQDTRLVQLSPARGECTRLLTCGLRHLHSSVAMDPAKAPQKIFRLAQTEIF